MSKKGNIGQKVNIHTNTPIHTYTYKKIYLQICKHPIYTHIILSSIISKICT